MIIIWSAINMKMRWWSRRIVLVLVAVGLVLSLIVPLIVTTDEVAAVNTKSGKGPEWLAQSYLLYRAADVCIQFKTSKRSLTDVLELRWTASSGKDYADNWVEFYTGDTSPWRDGITECNSNFFKKALNDFWGIGVDEQLMCKGSNNSEFAIFTPDTNQTSGVSYEPNCREFYSSASSRDDKGNVNMAYTSNYDDEFIAAIKRMVYNNSDPNSVSEAMWYYIFFLNFDIGVSNCSKSKESASSTISGNVREVNVVDPGTGVATLYKYVNESDDKQHIFDDEDSLHATKRWTCNELKDEINNRAPAVEAWIANDMAEQKELATAADLQQYCSEKYGSDYVFADAENDPENVVYYNRLCISGGDNKDNENYCFSDNNITGTTISSTSLRTRYERDDEDGYEWRQTDTAKRIEACLYGQGREFEFHYVPSLNSTDPDGNSPTPTCESQGGSMGWILCPITILLRGAVDTMMDLLTDQLEYQTLNDTTGGKVMKEVWNKFIPIANIGFAIVFLIVIYSTAIGGGIGGSKPGV
jgi:hypothetical protein